MVMEMMAMITTITYTIKTIEIITGIWQWKRRCDHEVGRGKEKTTTTSQSVHKYHACFMHPPPPLKTRALMMPWFGSNI